MKREKYSSADVEQILRELARFDKCRMDDAMTERILTIIDDEVERSSRKYVYKKIAHCAAVMMLMAVGISYFFVELSNEVTVVTVDTKDNDKGSQVIASERKVMLSQLDVSMESGFSPFPQEIYEGRDNKHYGVRVYGNYEYSACTDTL